MFFARTGERNELWRSDGTAAGTPMALLGTPGADDRTWYPWY
jgi:ELWxxDGT repeat protein